MHSRKLENRTRIGAFEHLALIHSDLDQFLSYIVPFVSRALDNHEAVLVTVGTDTIDPLRVALGKRAEQVQLTDANEWYPHSARRLRAFYESIKEELAKGSEHVWLVSEQIWSAGDEEAIREWQRYESVLNEVLQPFPATLICAYDASRLDPSILQGARRTHPKVREGKVEEESPIFERAEILLREWAFDLDAVPPNARCLTEFDSLAEVRQFLSQQVIQANLDPARATDLLIATNEILTNAIAYGNGVETICVWSEEGKVVCQIQDRGPGFEDPIISYRPPAEDPTNGRGLWLARQLVDFLKIALGPDGMIVRVEMKIA